VNGHIANSTQAASACSWKPAAPWPSAPAGAGRRTGNGTRVTRRCG